MAFSFHYVDTEEAPESSRIIQIEKYSQVIIGKNIPQVQQAIG